MGVSIEENQAIIVDAASKWWSARLRSEVGIGDNGDTGARGFMVMGLTGMLRDRHPITEAHVHVFENELRNRLDVAFDIATAYEDAYTEAIRANVNGPLVPDLGCTWYYDNSGWDNAGVDLCMSVDYSPCRMLVDALAVVGVAETVRERAALPWKTIMRLSRRRIIVAPGYNAPWEETIRLWGCSREERKRVLLAAEAPEEAYLAWRDGGRRGPYPERFGPVQQ